MIGQMKQITFEGQNRLFDLLSTLEFMGSLLTSVNRPYSFIVLQRLPVLTILRLLSVVVK